MKVSPTQITSIREWSQRRFDSADYVIDKYGKPADGETATAVLRVLQKSRDEDALREAFGDQEVAMEETRVCVECETEKPIEDFKKAGRGRSRTCTSCNEGANPTRFDPPPEPDLEIPDQMPQEVPSVPVVDKTAFGDRADGPTFADVLAQLDDLRQELSDPRLSTLEAIRHVLDENIGALLDESVDGFTLDHAAALAQELADLEVA